MNSGLTFLPRTEPARAGLSRAGCDAWPTLSD